MRRLRSRADGREHNVSENERDSRQVTSSVPVGDADEGKWQLRLKSIGSGILDYLSGSVSPILPAFMVAGLFKTVQVILGPTLLGLISADDDLYLLCNQVFNAVFYFLPVYLGYTSARKLGATPVLGLLVACILLEPSFVKMSEEGAALSVYGIPTIAYEYRQTVLPILLSVWVMSYVERFFNRVLPEMLRTTFAPFLTIAVMLPVTLCALGPFGWLAGDLIAKGLLAAANAGGAFSVLAMGALTALQPLLVVTGLHQVLIALGLSTLASQGSESFVYVANTIFNWTIWAVGLAAFLRFKDAGQKAVGLNCLISGAIGGLSEPTLYGLCLRYPRSFAGPVVGSLAAGLFCGAFHVTYYILGGGSVLSILCFMNPAGGPNVLFAFAAGLIAFAVSLVVTLAVGFGEAAADEPVAEVVEQAADDPGGSPVPEMLGHADA